MIVLLLSCLNSYAQNLNDSLPSTGKVLQSDTAKVTVPAILIKQANAKMIERKYLLVINSEQDSIIELNRKYIAEQQKIIEDFQNRVYQNTIINERINKDLERQKKRTKILGGCAAGATIAFIISLIIK